VFSGYLGGDQEVWKDYDAAELVKSGHKSEHKILIDQGTSDPFLAEQLQPEILGAACEVAGQAVEIRLQDGYDHSYYFISTFMEDHIRHHAEILSKTARG
jgi:S-formylglutathione hydrolase